MMMNVDDDGVGVSILCSCSWWNILWTWSSNALRWDSAVARGLLHWQRVNHFPGNRVRYCVLVVVDEDEDGDGDSNAFLRSFPLMVWLGLDGEARTAKESAEDPEHQSEIAQ